MGVKTTITLKQVQSYFPKLNVIALTPTLEGITDTTYILHNNTKKYVLKKYENKAQKSITTHLKLLQKLHSCSLDVPKLITNVNGWYVFSYTQGSYFKTINYYSLQRIALMIKKIHHCTQKYYCNRDISERINIEYALKREKKHYYFYKKFLPLKSMSKSRDGLIHGDIFWDNILNKGTKVSIIDFSDAADGRFSFDLGVTLSSLCSHPNRKHYIDFFLKVYNQNNRLKITKHALLEDLEYAKLFYELLKRNIK